MDNENLPNNDQALKKNDPANQFGNELISDLKTLIKEEVEIIIQHEKETLQGFFDAPEKMEEMKNIVIQETEEMALDVIKESLREIILLRIQKAKKRAEREAKRKSFLFLHEKVDNELDKLFEEYAGKIRKRFDSDEEIEKFKNQCRENSYNKIEDVFKEELMKTVKKRKNKEKVKKDHNDMIDQIHPNGFLLERGYEARDLNKEEDGINDESIEPPYKRQKRSL